MNASANRRWRRRIGASAALAMVLATATAAPSIAGQPSQEHFAGQSTIVSESLCAFPVTITTDYNGVETDFGNGDLQEHLVQQDTFRANGETLTGTPYTVNADARFDSNGNIVSATAQGVVEKIWLPDGQLFIGAGRVNFLVEHGDFIVVPDVGSSPDVGALCAALIPKI